MHSLLAIVRRQAAAAWRFRWLAVVVTWLVCAAGWTYVWRIPNVYESSARMFVDADAVLTPLLRGIAVDSQTANQLDMLQRTLLSRPNLEKLISKTDLELELRSPSDRQAMVDRLATEIRIIPQTRNLISVAFRSQSPRLAYDVVRTMLATFVESKAGTSRTDMENAARFLNEQITAYEEKLKEAERRRAEFRTRYMDLLPRDDGVNRLQAAQGTVRSLQGQLTDATAKRVALTRELATTPQLIVTETEGGGPGGPGGSSRLSQAERTLQELRLRYTDSHPDVISQRNLVEAIRSGRAGQGDPAPAAPRVTGPRSRSAPNPIYEQLKVRIVENESVIASLTRQVDEATRESNRLEEIARGAPGLEAESVNLDRDYNVLRKNYEDLLARRESMRISTAADTSTEKVKVQIIDPPQVPQNPIAPRRALLISGVLLAGLGAGAALAFLLVQMDNSFHSTDDLRELGFPVVGGVSLLVAAVPLRRRLASLAGFVLAMMVPGVVYGGLMFRLMTSNGSV